MQSLSTLLAASPTLVENTINRITPESLMSVLVQVANTPAPSGASSLTRGPVIQSWFESRQMSERGASLNSNAYNSGTEVFSYGSGGLGLLAHLDEVSYLFLEPIEPGLAKIVPYCYHLAEQPAPARIVRFTPDGDWSIVCDAMVHMRMEHHYVSYPVNVEIGVGDRISLASPLTYKSNTGLVTGSMDNAAGVAAALVAGEMMTHLDIPFNCYFTDEEEGPAGASSQTISRGAARLLSKVEPAPLTVAIDIHGLNEADLAKSLNHEQHWGASFAEFSSGGRGSVAPPELFLKLSEAFRILAKNGICVNQNIGGYVPRSDDVVAMLHSNRVVILGYPGLNRHFDRGLPTVNIHDLVDLARALVIIGAMVCQVKL